MVYSGASSERLWLEPGVDHPTRPSARLALSGSLYRDTQGGSGAKVPYVGLHVTWPCDRAEISLQALVEACADLLSGPGCWGMAGLGLGFVLL